MLRGCPDIAAALRGIPLETADTHCLCFGWEKVLFAQKGKAHRKGDGKTDTTHAAATGSAAAAAGEFQAAGRGAASVPSLSPFL